MPELSLKINLFTFSSSGNTLYLCRALAKNFSHEGDVTLRRMELTDPKNAMSGDLTGFCFPVFAWHLPLTVSRFIDNMPMGTGETPVFVFVSFGGTKGNVLSWAKRRLQRKGYRVIWAGGLRCEDNHPVLRRKWTRSFIIHQVPFERDAKAMVVTAEEIISVFREKKKRRIFFNPLYLFFELIWLVYHSTRGFWMRKYVIRDKCTLCGLCVEHCPAKAIKWGSNGYPEAETLCDDCYRCVNICPTEAFQSRWTLHGKRYRRLIGEIVK